MQRLAPPELAEHWDNPGLLVDCGGDVRRVLVTLDITPEVVEEAARKGCRYLRIDTNVRNTRARRLYHSLGYKEISVAPCTFNGLSDIDLVLLEKAL